MTPVRDGRLDGVGGSARFTDGARGTSPATPESGMDLMLALDTTVSFLFIGQTRWTSLLSPSTPDSGMLLIALMMFSSRAERLEKSRLPDLTLIVIIPNEGGIEYVYLP